MEQPTKTATESALEQANATVCILREESPDETRRNAEQAALIAAAIPPATFTVQQMIAELAEWDGPLTNEERFQLLRDDEDAFRILKSALAKVQKRRDARIAWLEQYAKGTGGGFECEFAQVRIVNGKSSTVWDSEKLRESCSEELRAKMFTKVETFAFNQDIAKVLAKQGELTEEHLACRTITPGSQYYKFEWVKPAKTTTE